MNNENLVAQHYLQTQILGAYETANIIWQSDSKGDSHRTFQDSFVYADKDSHTIERDMVVEGKLFRVHSVFNIVKDMSRLGRDYLKVGQIMEILRQKGIRLIAINDGVDSDKQGDNDFTPFRNLFNDFYAKHCSKKVRSVKKAQSERGERVAMRAPYGYKKGESNPQKIVPDSEAAEVVKRIFKLCAEGRGPSQIARQITDEKIVNPTNYYFNLTGVALTKLDRTRTYNWSKSTIMKILDDESYLGHTISMKHTTVSYKNKKQILRPESE